MTNTPQDATREKVSVPTLADVQYHSIVLAEATELEWQRGSNQLSYLFFLLHFNACTLIGGSVICFELRVLRGIDQQKTAAGSNPSPLICTKFTNAFFGLQMVTPESCRSGRSRNKTQARVGSERIPCDEERQTALTVTRIINPVATNV